MDKRRTYQELLLKDKRGVQELHSNNIKVKKLQVRQTIKYCCLIRTTLKPTIIDQAETYHFCGVRRIPIAGFWPKFHEFRAVHIPCRLLAVVVEFQTWDQAIAEMSNRVLIDHLLLACEK